MNAYICNSYGDIIWTQNGNQYQGLPKDYEEALIQSGMTQEQARQAINGLERI